MEDKFSGGEVVFGVDLLVESKHLLPEVDAHILNADVLARQEIRQEVSGDALCVFLIDVSQVVALSIFAHLAFLREIHFVSN